MTSGCINGINSVDAIHLTDGRQYLQFEINITAPDQYKTQNIELSVAEPVAGGKPSTTAVCTSGYAIPGTPSWTPADTTFKSGTKYTVKIPVKAEYQWGDTSTVTANGDGNISILDATQIQKYIAGLIRDF